MCIQNLLRRHGLGHVLVSTVDSSQGSEADMVIISFVRSRKKLGSKTVGFLDDDRRINVALTRAKYIRICIGNSSYLSNSGVKTLSALVHDGKKHNLICEALNLRPWTDDQILFTKKEDHHASQIVKRSTDQLSKINDQNDKPRRDTIKHGVDRPNNQNGNIRQSIKFQENIQKLETLKRQLPFAQTNLMEKKRLRSQISVLENDIFTNNC